MLIYINTMGIVFFIAVLFLSQLTRAQYEVDSMCGAKVNLAKSGKLLVKYTESGHVLIV